MPLCILIAGAGIAGLTAAIALAPSGHSITIVEKSSFTGEIGAAFHLNPPAVRILKRLGVDVAAMRPSVCERFNRSDAVTLAVANTKFDLRQKQAQLGLDEDDVSVYRPDAHNVLKAKALGFANVRLVCGNGLQRVDAASGTAVLADGEEVHADVVVGADGIHSRAVAAIDPQVVAARPTGVNLYRWMVETKKAREDPEVSAWLDKAGFPARHNTFALAGTKHFLVCYACRNGELINCATLQPALEDMDQLPGESYACPGTVEQVVHLMRPWPKQYSSLARLSMDVKRWALLTRDVPVASFKDRLVIIGDAAHPCHPTHGIGANLGVEDAGVLGTVLGPDVDAADVTSRLKLFNDLRYERTAIAKGRSEMVPNGGSDNSANVAKQLGDAVFVEEKEHQTMEDFLWSSDVVSNARTAVSQLVVA